jgi:hypothetical protein
MVTIWDGVESGDLVPDDAAGQADAADGLILWASCGPACVVTSRAAVHPAQVGGPAGQFLSGRRAALPEGRAGP